MAVTDAYCTAVTYRGLVSKTDASDDVEVLEDLKAVSRFIDRITARFFTQDASAVARIYYPPVSRLRMLLVDDIASSAGLELKVDEDRDGLFTAETAWTISTDYKLSPLNADKGPEPQPWNALWIPEWSSKTLWTVGVGVQLTAIFGFPAVPKAIERATAHLCGILRIESPRATARVQEGLEEAFAASPRATSIISDLVNVYGRGETLEFS